MQEDTGFTGLSGKTSGTDKSFQLYDTPRKINVETFYEIMETQNLELLKVKEQKVSQEKLSDVWFDLLEFYYSNTNQQSFKKFLQNIRTVVSIEQELVSCYAAFDMVKFGEDYGYEILRKCGIKTNDHQRIESAILRKETKLELARRRLKTDGKDEKVNFYKIVSSVEGALNRQLNLSEINLERWVAYLNDVKERNEQAKQQHNKRKKWQGK